MDPALAPRRSGRARRTVEYKEPSSCEGSIGSPESSPTDFLKPERENELHTRSNTYDPPLTPYHLYTSSTQSEGARREANPSAWSLPSDVPIYPYIYVKTSNARESITAPLSSPPPIISCVRRHNQPVLNTRSLSRIKGRSPQYSIHLLQSSIKSLQTQPNSRKAMLFRL